HTRQDAHQPAHPYPTRRSSDLSGGSSETEQNALTVIPWSMLCSSLSVTTVTPDAKRPKTALKESGSILISPLNVISKSRFYRRRSEEHTSELQSRENLVCRLLL